MSFRIFPYTAGVLFEDDDIVVQTFAGGCTEFATQGSIFFAVIEGRTMVNGYKVSPGMYGCIPHVAIFNSAEPCRVMIVEAKRYHAIFSLGGPVEPEGRLRYIDGCTDTGLIAPFRLGDPCLNYLYFPPDTQQTAHTHPSHRVGAIYDGEGVCLTEKGPTPMRQGDVFIIPADALHWFSTEDSPMRIIVFHPDSEFGPTDELHQMREATLIAEPAQ